MAEKKSHPLSDEMKAHDRQLENSDDVLPAGHRIFAIIGPKGSGKSSVMLSLLTSKKSPFRKHFNNIILVSPTAKYDDKMMPLYEELDSEGKYFDTLNEGVAEDIIELLNTLNDGKKKPRNLIILDDCTHSFPSGKKANKISELFTTSRHLKASIWVVCHKYNAMPTLFRNQLDAMFVFRTSSKAEVESMKKGLNCDEAEFERKLKEATEEDHSFLFVDLAGGKCKMYKRFDQF
jgi:hypothetical protein